MKLTREYLESEELRVESLAHSRTVMESLLKKAESGQSPNQTDAIAGLVASVDLMSDCIRILSEDQAEIKQKLDRLNTVIGMVGPRGAN
jgi:chemotaxis protein histidine kinase CheA